MRGRATGERASPRRDAPGLSFREGAPLVARALAMLEEVPLPAEALARRVLGLRQAPPGLADRLVRELLGGDPRVRVDGSGVWRLRRDGRAADPRLNELRWAVVDLETTGGDPANSGRIVEIAVVEARTGWIGEPFTSLVNPGVPVEPWVSRLTGITERQLSEAPRFGEIADRVRRELEGRIFVAHNASFDWRFLSEEMWRAGRPLPTGPRLCTLRLARRALPGLERRGLDSAAAYYGIEVRPRQRAAGDALATADLLLRLLEEASRRGVERWSALTRWLRGGGRRAGDGAAEIGGGGPGIRERDGC